MGNFSPDSRRQRVSKGKVWFNDGYDSGYQQDWVEAPNGTHIRSRIEQEFDHWKHLPVLDVDNESIKIYPSQTQGHFHVYIDRPMSWRKYKKLMKLLVEAGVVDKEWYKMTLNRGQGYLRVIPPPPKPISMPPKKLPRPKPEDRVENPKLDWGY